MSATEIILIVIGVAIFLLGYLMPARKKDLDEEVQLISEDEVRKLVAGEVEHVKGRIADIVEETVNYSIERTERAMERVTNEKIMAVNEYSDTVLEEINKNHKEVVFLYDMLNDKHDNLMSTINEATVAADAIKQTAKDTELTVQEAADKIDAVLQAADDAAEMVRDAEDAAEHVQNMAQEAVRSVMSTAENTKRELTLMHNTNPYRGEIVEEVRRTRRYGNTVEEVRGAQTAAWRKPPALPENPRYSEKESDGWRSVEDMLSAGELDGWLDVNDMRNAGAGDMGEWHDANDMRTVDAPDGLQDVSSPEAVDDMAPAVVDQDVPDDNGSVEEAVGETVQSLPEETPEEVDFTPISPRRVEIIHQPDGDYVAENMEDMSTSAAFASMGIFAPKAEESEESKRKARTRRSTRRDRLQDNAATVDIQFAQGKDNGRNSNERILELHKAGKSNMAIAKELGLGLGEVKLVIDLFEGM